MLATKYSLTLDPRDPNAGGNHRKSLVRSLEQSLRRLNTDYVDLLWLHMRDATTPIEEAVRALDDQVRLGKVLYVGISDSPAWVAAQANTIADLRGWSPFVALQIPYSVAQPGPGAGAAADGGVARARARAVGRARRRHPDGQARRRAPLARGSRQRADGGARRRPAPDRGRPRRDAGSGRDRVAPRRARPADDRARSWARGPRRRSIENLGALELELDPDERSELDEAGAPTLGFPRSFLESDDVRNLIYGETWERLEAVAR